ncbi:hypothetical protein [Geoglobus acetivorans]|uniref:Uncharacterized protein n=1 Tax=Geoglobus acetivorans TaxID=565033 RepID=A0A0A7GGN8_GEOAI|nr:hypothetical protein GACE_2178 [Geoglobus acetivorans]
MFRKFKNTMSKKKSIDLDNLKKYSIATEKWLYHYFKIGFTISSNINDEELPQYLSNLERKVLEFCLGVLVSKDGAETKDGLYYFGNLGKNVSVVTRELNKNEYEILVRFPDMLDEDYERPKGAFVRYAYPDEREYKFSPIQSLIAARILPEIEKYLCMLFNVEPHQVYDYYYLDERGLPYVTQFDGVQFLDYSLEKRLRLHFDLPELERQIFGSSFEKYVKHILDKKEDDEYMMEYCSKVEKLIRNYI